jgi:DNA-binding NarL/FixJ family response regulator
MIKIRVLIIDDNNLLRDGCVDMLKTHPNLEVESHTGNDATLDTFIARFNPHIILLNSGLQIQNSLQLIQHLVKSFRNIKLVVMCSGLNRNEIARFMDAGATRAVIKDTITLEFIEMITELATGQNKFPVYDSELLLSRLVNQAKVKGINDRSESVQINEMELLLLKHLSDGLSDKEIAIELKISAKRVRTHIHNIKQKLYLFALLDSSAALE